MKAKTHPLLSVKTLITFLLVVMVLTIFPGRQVHAATPAFTGTMCKGNVEIYQASNLSAGHTLKWKVSNSAYLKITKTSQSGTVAKVSVKGLKTTKGTYIKALEYDSKGKYVKTYLLKITIKAHNYKVTKAATCQAQGTKTCTLCKKKIAISKKAHTYKWVMTNKSVDKVPNDSINTYKTKNLTSGKWAFYDEHICNSIDLRDEYGTPYSDVRAYFTGPSATKIASEGKLQVRIKTKTIKYNDTWTHYAQGGMWSTPRLYSHKLSLTQMLSGYEPSNLETWKFDSIKDIGVGYADVTRWYGHAYSNGFLGQTWDNIYEVRMPRGEKVGAKIYLLISTDAAYHWYTYTWSATCH